MSRVEIPVCFECKGEALIGMVHTPDNPKNTGILMIIAGGPQYRVGVGRQLATLARSFSQQGYPVMRFDYRGTGDSGGEHLGFEQMGDDIDAAIRTFISTLPTVTNVVLWGGCNAASTALMEGPNNPRVSGMIISNPWVHSDELKQKAMRRYYLRRLTQKSFWIKLLKFKFNPGQTLKSVVSDTKSNPGKTTQPPMQTQNHAKTKQTPFQTRMLEGAQKFKGNILLLISGHSVVAQEFDTLVASSKPWKKALNRAGVTRVEFQDANQTFSTSEERDKLMNTAINWLNENTKTD